MDIQSLPRYRGLPNSPKGWGEQDEQGKMPMMRLRDWVVLSVIIMSCLPINLCRVVQYWVCHQNLVIANSLREESLRNGQLEP